MLFSGAGRGLAEPGKKHKGAVTVGPLVLPLLPESGIIGKTPMSESIEFVLHGKINGEEITPSTINLSQFNEFNRQVEDFIAGRHGGKLDTVRVEIKDGSYCLGALMSIAMTAAVDSDMEKLMRGEDALGDVDPKRAEIVKNWQSKASAHEDMFFEVRSSTSLRRGSRPLRISHETHFRFGDKSPWVVVEKYLFGTVEEMGGSTSSNVHLRLPKSGKIVIVDSDRANIEARPVLYQKVLLRVRAEEHARTGELRKLRLIDFVDYKPGYDEAALDRFAEEGAKAWADIPDGAAWVRDRRGG